MKRKTKPSKSGAPVVVAVIGFVLVGALGYYIATSPGQKVPKPPAASQDSASHPEVKVYTPHYDDKGKLTLNQSIARANQDEDPHVFAVNKYLDQLSMVPKDGRAKTCIIKDGVANLDFSASFETTYGTEDEQTVLKGVLTAMAQFPEVKKVKFTVEGRTLESLGNIDLTEPQPVIPEAASSSGSSR